MNAVASDFALSQWRKARLIFSLIAAEDLGDDELMAGRFSRPRMSSNDVAALPDGAYVVGDLVPENEHGV